MSNTTPDIYQARRV